MGQKINPIGFRLGVSRGWQSRWYANNRNFGPMLAEDIKVRDFLKGKLAHASVGRVVIERPAKDARITIFSARPGVVIGKKGEEIEALKAELRRLMGVNQVHVNIEEIRKPEIDAQLIADSIAQQLEKRIMFRRAMKRAMQNAMRLGAQGIKIMSAGRLNGIEIARTEWYREGRVPLHTLRADIDYGMGEAKTTYGVIGIKVWVYKGEVMPKAEAAAAAALGAQIPAPPAAEAPAEPRKAKRPAPKPGMRRGGPPKADGDRKPAAPRAKKPDAAAADRPKAIIKRPKKVLKAGEESAPPAAPANDAGEKKE
jgi:small subunit ribosomal protein S3